MVSRKYKYSEQQLRDAVKTSVSYNEVLRKLGIPVKGWNSQTVKRRIERYNIDISHFTGHSNRGGVKPYITADEYIKRCGVNVKSHILLTKLVKEGKKERVCEKCGIKDWNNEPIGFHLHHIDGNHSNNDLQNLQVLCPNCHSQTHDYHKPKEKPKYFCVVCGRELKTNCASRMCIYCSAKTRRKIEVRPPYEILKEEISINGYRATGKKYGVSDNAVRRWLKDYEKR